MMKDESGGKFSATEMIINQFLNFILLKQVLLNHETKLVNSEKKTGREELVSIPKKRGLLLGMIIFFNSKLL